MLKSKYHKQAFEIEDIHRRENFMFVYDPYDAKVEMYDTSRGVIGGKKIKLVYKRGFPFDCETAYDYFVHMINKSTSFEAFDNKVFFFLGWVDPETVQPLNEVEHEGVKLDNEDEIKKKLELAHGEFLSSLTNEKIKQKINEYGFISGGAIASIISDENVNDYDYHFTNKEALEEVWEYFESKYLGNRIINFGMELPISVTDNAITLPGDVQIIKRDYGEPEDVCSKFDFVHCMAYYIPKTNKLVVPYDAYQHIDHKSLQFNKQSDTPVTSYYRMMKFAERGWKSFRNEEAKLLRKLAEKDFSQQEIDELEGASYY